MTSLNVAIYVIQVCNEQICNIIMKCNITRNVMNYIDFNGVYVAVTDRYNTIVNMSLFKGPYDES